MKHIEKVPGGRKSILLALTGAAVAAGTTFALVQPAQAIPTSQSVCNLGTVVDSPGDNLDPQILTDARSVTVSSPQTVKVSVTADIGVDSGAELRLAWSVNNSPLNEGNFGPANFANHQEFFETRSTFALIPVGAGTTTIQPFVRLSGPTGKRATILHRCMTIEATTS